MPELLRALGFPPPKRNRTRCILHDGDNATTFAINSDNGTWYCFKCNEGGGKLKLVQRTLGLDRKAGLTWLADLAGVPLGAPWTPEERSAWARRRRTAEAEARDLVLWRDGLLRALREIRNSHFDAYHRGKAYIIHHSMDGPIADLAADVADICEAKYLDFDRKISAIEEAPFDALLSFYRAARRAEAA